MLRKVHAISVDITCYLLLFEEINPAGHMLCLYVGRLAYYVKRLVYLSHLLRHHAKGILLPAKAFAHSGATMCDISHEKNKEHSFLSCLRRHLLSCRDRPSVIANMSARVGSISDNKLGGWYSYRASKTALNQLTKTMAIECTRRKTNVSCIMLHPGTVDTDLSAPFQKVW